MRKVLVADDHQLIRMGLQIIIDRMKDIKVCCLASDGAEAIRFLSEGRPDLAILDISMPEKSGIEVLHFIKNNKDLNTKVLMNSMHSDYGNIYQCKNLGAEGYIFKDASDEELQEAIYTILNGEEYYSPGAKRMMAMTISNEEYQKEKAKQMSLSPDEYTTLKLIVDGRNDEDIIEALKIKDNKLQELKNDLLKKLNAKNIADLVRIAIKKNLITV